MEQQTHETIDQYLIKLRQLSEPCQFGTLEDEMVQDRLVLGCKDSAARTRLFREKSCDLKKAIESLRISEATSEQLKKIEGDGIQEPVNFMEKQGTKKPPWQKRPGIPKKRSGNTTGRQFKEKRECIYCGGHHQFNKNKCPAFGKTCRKCGKPNHFSSVCFQKESLNYAQGESASEDESVYCIEFVGALDHQQRKRFFAPLRFFDENGEALIQCHLDTGATCNVMSFDRLCEIEQSGKPAMQPTRAKLNPKKLKLRLLEVPFIGHLLTPGGVKPDPEKVHEVQEMPNPDGQTNAEKVKAVQRILGFVNYLAKFVPHLADECEPLRRLTDKDTDWVWEKHHQDAFDRVKQLVADYPVLSYYNVNLPVTIQCDSSDTGMGAALLQEGQPVAFASRTLTPTERGYAQIEKECLAIVFSCERFNQYIFGRESISIQSDHKPLEAIFTKPLTAAPKRLQGMLLRLQKFNLKVGYKKGAEMFLADTLSRAPLPSTAPPTNCLRPEHEEVCRLDLENVNAAEFLRISNDGLENIQRLTEADNQLQRLKMTVLQGWPEAKQQIEPQW